MYQIIKTYPEYIEGLKERTNKGQTTKERTFIEHLLYPQLVKIMIDKNIDLLEVKDITTSMVREFLTEEYVGKTVNTPRPDILLNPNNKKLYNHFMLDEYYFKKYIQYKKDLAERLYSLSEYQADEFQSEYKELLKKWDKILSDNEEDHSYIDDSYCTNCNKKVLTPFIKPEEKENPDIVKLQEELKRLKEENQQLLQEKQNTEKGNQQLLSKVNELESENQQLLSKVNRLESENQQLLQKITDLENENNLLLEKAENAETIEDIQLEPIVSNNELIEENALLTQTIGELEAKIDKLEIENQNQSQTIKQFNDLMALQQTGSVKSFDSAHEVEELKKELEKEKNQFKKLKKGAQRLAKVIDALYCQTNMWKNIFKDDFDIIAYSKFIKDGKSHNEAYNLSRYED